MKKVLRNYALSGYLNYNDKKKSWWSTSSLVLGLPQGLHDSTKHNKKIKITKYFTKKSKADPTTSFPFHEIIAALRIS